jgi:hypothetical protein
MWWKVLRVEEKLDFLPLICSVQKHYPACPLKVLEFSRPLRIIYYCIQTDIAGRGNMTRMYVSASVMDATQNNKMKKK